jgi:hypothetical protein
MNCRTRLRNWKMSMKSTSRDKKGLSVDTGTSRPGEGDYVVTHDRISLHPGDGPATLVRMSSAHEHVVLERAERNEFSEHARARMERRAVALAHEAGTRAWRFTAERQFEHLNQDEHS